MLVIIAALVMVLFQNCGVPTFSVSGNGNGYGGAPVGDDPSPGPGTDPTGQLPVGNFVNRLENAVCDDGSDVRARITIMADKIYLSRQDCRDLAPVIELPSTAVQYSGASLIYDGYVFHYQ